MSMTPAEVERKVHQLDNDVQSIYDLLNGITTTQQRHSNRFNELAEQVGRLETRLDGVESRLDGVESKLGGVESKLGGVESRLDGIEGKLNTVLELLRDR